MLKALAMVYFGGWSKPVFGLKKIAFFVRKKTDFYKIKKPKTDFCKILKPKTGGRPVLDRFWLDQ